MNDTEDPKIGTILWRDLTVDDASEVSDFYKDVVGWTCEAVDMGGYSDFSMVPPGGGGPIAGVCHARGSNADLPPQWLLYVVVADVAESARRCLARGGEILVEPRPLSGGRFCVIRDPAGAACALYSKGELE